MATTVQANGKKPKAMILADYCPMGQKDPIKLTVDTIVNYCVNPTKSGKIPDNKTIMQFAALCKARELNPLIGDAYLVGYDSRDGANWSLITAVQALFKRADLHPQYDGQESGIIVLTTDGVMEERHGEFFLDGEELVGGWSKVHRKDRAVPETTRVKLETYSTGRSHWAKDPARMITKCAEAAALRKAFPNQTSGLYIAEEAGIMEKQVVSTEPEPVETAAVSRVDLLEGSITTDEDIDGEAIEE